MVRLGDPVEMTWTCAHMPDLKPPICGKDAIQHGINWDELVSVFSCGDHIPKMKEVVDVDHPLGSACGLLGSIYSEVLGTCVMPDSGHQIETLLTAELSMVS